MLLFFIRHGDPNYFPDQLTPLGHRQAEAVAKRLALYGLDEIYSSSAVRAKETAQPTAELLHKDVTILDWMNEDYAWHDLSLSPELLKERRESDGPEGLKRFLPTDPSVKVLELPYPMWAFLIPETVELFQSPAMAALGQNWCSHPFFTGTNFGPGYDRIVRETRAFLDGLGFSFEEERGLYRVKAPANDRRIGVFAHQGFGLAFLSVVLGVPYPRFSTSFDFPHTGMNVLEFRTDREYTAPKLLTLGNDSHLYREGLPTNYQNRLYF